jgi:cysteinyl-tRNA synthetase
VRIYSTLEGQKKEFPAPGSEVRMYVCGITPYATAHVGHAMSYLIFDMVRRYLEFRGYRVRHVQNFTDIDDKIIQRAHDLGVAPGALAGQYSDEFLAEIRALNILPAHAYPRATEQIGPIQEMIGGLIERGHAYATGGDVYYRVRSKPDYGKLSHRNLAELRAGARVEIDAAKEDPMDFALWKGAKPGEPSWDSPWGPGRPGWHIECSAMSLGYLGETIDIHGGGQDLIFPHHENEIAQSEAYTGAMPFARFWMHNGLLNLGADKMSKSIGNLIPIREILARYSADAVRLFVLSSHYRSPLSFSEEGLAAMERGAERLRQAVALPGDGDAPGMGLAAYRARFVEAMDDDFNSAQAIAALFDLVREINRVRESGAATGPALALLRELGGVLGLDFRPPPRADGAEAAPFIDLLVATRAGLRGAQQWALADQIRDGLKQLGVTLEDSPQGTSWRFE